MLQLSNKIHAHLLPDTLISHGLEGSTAEVKAAETVSEEDGGGGGGEGECTPASGQLYVRVVVRLDNYFFEKLVNARGLTPL
jgi:hypothetical protein